MKQFPYLPCDREQRQQAADLKEKYHDCREECFTLIGKHGEMLLVLLSYNEDMEPNVELPD